MWRRTAPAHESLNLGAPGLADSSCPGKQVVRPVHLGWATAALRHDPLASWISDQSKDPRERVMEGKGVHGAHAFQRPDGETAVCMPVSMCTSTKLPHRDLFHPMSA